jgi:RloB-like protein
MRADLRARARAEKSFVPKAGLRSPRALFLIICEDSKSSPAYFEDARRRLRLSTAEVQVYGKECGSAPISVVRFGEECRKKRMKEGWTPDRVFCVVDVDHHTTLDAAHDFAAAHRLDFVVSRPCFERWYLLHFEQGDRPHDSYDQLLKQLKKYLPRYDKGTFRDFDLLWEGDRVDVAMVNARRLRKSREQDPEQMAYTDVDLLIEALREAATRP